MIVSGFRAALDFDTYPHRNLIRPRCAERAKPKAVLIMHIGFLACFHAIHISRTQSFQRNRHILFLALVTLKLLVSLISRLVACSARIVADKQTDRQTDRQTYRTTTVTLAAYARRGLIISTSQDITLGPVCYVSFSCWSVLTEPARTLNQYTHVSVSIDIYTARTTANDRIDASATLQQSHSFTVLP